MTKPLSEYERSLELAEEILGYAVGMRIPENFLENIQSMSRNFLQAEEILRSAQTSIESLLDWGNVNQDQAKELEVWLQKRKEQLGEK